MSLILSLMKLGGLIAFTIGMLAIGGRLVTWMMDLNLFDSGDEDEIK
jgi:hypothetical protein